nr:uncharacterized protein LOC113394246 [Vanessa tameamea]
MHERTVFRSSSRIHYGPSRNDLWAYDSESLGGLLSPLGAKALSLIGSLNILELFANEELIYKVLSKVMTSLQDQTNIPVEDKLKIAKDYEETNNEAILLENLCKRDYKRFDKNESISLKFVELGVQELAKLHGISFVIEKKMPKYFKEIIAALDAPYHFDDDWNELMRKVFEYIANLLDDKTKKKIERLVPIWLKKVPKYHNDKTTKCALCHGDYKKNYVMFRVIKHKFDRKTAGVRQYKVI